MGSHEKDPASPRRAPSRSNSTVSSKHSSVQQGSESWEVVEEPRGRGSPSREPPRQEGFLLKKRKWPLKGWHKRYFVLENGILTYATTRQDVLKGKLHGAIDVRQSVMSVNKKAQRVDLDTEDNIYHLKIKSPELFASWVSSLCSHHQGERPDPLACPSGGPAGTTPTAAQGPWTRILPSGSAPALSALASSRDKVDAWLKDSEGLERCSAELSACQEQLRELTGMLQSLESLHRIPSAPLISSGQPSAAAERPKKGRRSTRIWCTQSFAKDDSIGRVGRLHGSVPNLSRYLEPGQLPFSLPPEYSQLQRSFWLLAQKVHGSLSSVVVALTAERARLEEMRQALDRRRSAPRPGSAGPTGVRGAGLRRVPGGTHGCRDLAGPRHRTGGLLVVGRSHDPLVARVGGDGGVPALAPAPAPAEPPRRPPCPAWRRGTGCAASTPCPSPPTPPWTPSPRCTPTSPTRCPPRAGSSSARSAASPRWPTRTPSSSTACEVFLSASSSENEASDDESCISEATNSICEDPAEPGGPGHPQTGVDGPGGVAEPPPLDLPGPGPQRRSCLPAPPAPPGDVSLWGLLRSSVGKDLSRVALPVQLNEPLNTLQRLCEELEYSALLDRAARARDPRQRLVLVAAFAVSAYCLHLLPRGQQALQPQCWGRPTSVCGPTAASASSVSRSATTPPSPPATPSPTTLSSGKTCGGRTNSGANPWRSSPWAPSTSGCPGEMPAPLTPAPPPHPPAAPPAPPDPHAPRSGDHFEWNKVTTCIHNVLSGPRWIEHYGEVLIRNTRDASYHCKLTFCKARYWGAGANEVQGAVLSRSGTVVERLAGKWHEGLYRGAPPGHCIWRANPMPHDHERNYGFTQFALELNELTPELRRLLPSTDTRLRPDQRYLEEGNVPAAETQKRQIEQLQRDRRRVMEENNITHQARFFRRLTDANGKESWVTNNTYWKLRLDPGFAHLDSAVLW
uniref:Oxysterol binding protein like 7 n=1 Tax=Anas platyrhynchos TaxID=8839 RepID=A0A8B9R3C3_ANAPL